MLKQPQKNNPDLKHPHVPHAELFLILFHSLLHTHMQGLPVCDRLPSVPMLDSKHKPPEYVWGTYVNPVGLHSHCMSVLSIPIPTAYVASSGITGKLGVSLQGAPSSQYITYKTYHPSFHFILHFLFEYITPIYTLL